MSIAQQITRIQQDRNKIRAKLVALGLANNTDNLDTLAQSMDNIVDQGSISASVREGETYTIPKGYHSGSGTVSGVAGGGSYNLQSKTGIIPTKKQQQITPDSGHYGLSDVTIEPIPDAYQDVTSVTAVAGDVLSGKIIVNKDGQTIAGTMDNNGAVAKTLTTDDHTYTVPAGYHSGSGTVKIVPEDKTITPTETTQDIVASTGKVLNKVTVNPIPSQYEDVSDATVTSDEVLSGEVAYSYDKTSGPVRVVGTMTNNGTITQTLDATNGKQSYTIPKGYHNGSGKVSITLEEKSATPSKSAQTISPTSGKVLSKVSVAAIPAAYQDVTKVDATAADVLNGKKIVSSSGTVVTGSMSNNGAINATIDGLTSTSYTVPAGYTTGGSVSLTGAIEEALSAI